MILTVEQHEITPIRRQSAKTPPNPISSPSTLVITAFTSTCTLMQDSASRWSLDLFEDLDHRARKREDQKTVTTYTHQRVQSLRLSAIVETNRGIPGTTPPFCPIGPTLDRPGNTESGRDLTTARRGSPLRRLSLTNYALSTRLRYAWKHQQQESCSSRKTVNMPHAISMPHSGFQALIMCGPGIGLNTFTCVPSEFPKALVNVANRPMVWYVLDWCYRMGVTDITLVTPLSSKDALAAALAQNPYLTSLPSPSPDLLAPPDLEHTTPTAELLRLPEIQQVIHSDFLLLPCDLICDVSGEAFLDTYLLGLGRFGDVGSLFESDPVSALHQEIRRGGLSIWYNTSGREESVKHEECDFMGTVGLDRKYDVPLSTKKREAEVSQGHLRQLVTAMPMSELKDQCEERKAWKIRSSLGRKHPNVKFNAQYRDSHIYFMPRWVRDFARLNKDFESVSEDLIGTWAKTGWRKPGYRARYHAQEIFRKRRKSQVYGDRRNEAPIEEEIDLMSLSSTQTTRYDQPVSPQAKTTRFASRVPADPEESILSNTNDEEANNDTVPEMPPILAYVLPSVPSAPLVRRVDTTPLLLSVSLLLAKLPSIEDATTSKQSSTSPFAHPSKVASTSSIAQKVTITRSDTLIDSNTSIATQCVIKGSVIGSTCTIGQSARLTNCLIMDGAVIGDKCVLTSTVVGKKAKIGNSCILQNCEVQDGNVVSSKTEGKNEKYLTGGLEDDNEVENGYADNDDDKRAANEMPINE